MASQSTNVVCPVCGAVNRIPSGRNASEAKCGGCGAPLFDGRPVNVDAKAFAKQIARSDVPVLVDFWAPWCGPCRMMAPAFDGAARKLEPSFRLVKLDTQSQPEIGVRHNIRSIPTMALFVGGREVARTSGAMGEAQIVQWARQAFGETN